MKSRLHDANNFNLKLIGAIAGSMSVVLYPALAHAEASENPQDISQQVAEVEVPSLKISSSPVPEAMVDDRELIKYSPLPISANQILLLANDTELPRGLRKIAAIEQQTFPISSNKIQPFQPATDTELPRGLRKIAAGENSDFSSIKREALISLTEIQPFQPTSDTSLPAKLRKIAEIEKQIIPVSTAIKILTPTPESVVDVQATTVILQFAAGSQVELRVNGVLVDAALVGRTETDNSNNLATQTWYGVSLKEGENVISAQVAGGKEPPVTVRVVVRGAPQKLKVEIVESRIPADGRSTATVRGQLIDSNGNRSNRDAVVTLIPTAGEFVGTDFKPDQPGFQVEAKGGEFTANLRSHLQAQTATIRAIANDLEAFTQVQFETALRPSLVTGVINLRLGARGTNYYDRFRDFLPPDKNNSTQLDFHSAVFATGAIGEWLFTGAYNSSRPLNEDCNCNNRLFRTYQSSEQNYPV